ncbi:hypothetical protein [Streptomyces sp. NPDC056264]|uniref:hypothetical protein n=1 Tax=Streptomyces sp. NPDC056264 TaxID=3345767 RepID=UPI003AAAD743
MSRSMGVLMGVRVKRALAAGAAGMLAALSGVVTNLITDSPSWTLGIALAVLVSAGVGAQVYLNDSGTAQGEPVSVLSAGPGSIAIGGSAHGSVRAGGQHRGGGEVPMGPGGGIAAVGGGSVAIGGDALGPVSAEADTER